MHHAVRSARWRGPVWPPGGTEPEYHARHDPESAAKLSTTVAHALADVMGIEVTDSGFALYDSIDPEALDRLFAPAADGRLRSAGHVAFAVEGYRVTAYSDGRIVITPPVDHFSS